MNDWLNYLLSDWFSNWMIDQWLTKLDDLAIEWLPEQLNN
jgi:hypothetical protein